MRLYLVPKLRFLTRYERVNSSQPTPPLRTPLLVGSQFNLVSEELHDFEHLYAYGLCDIINGLCLVMHGGVQESQYSDIAIYPLQRENHLVYG